jgi:hypothetical protein
MISFASKVQDSALAHDPIHLDLSRLQMPVAFVGIIASMLPMAHNTQYIFGPNLIDIVKEEPEKVQLLKPFISHQSLFKS